MILQVKKSIQKSINSIAFNLIKFKKLDLIFLPRISIAWSYKLNLSCPKIQKKKEFLILFYANFINCIPNQNFLIIHSDRPLWSLNIYSPKNFRILYLFNFVPKNSYNLQKIELLPIVRVM